MLAFDGAQAQTFRGGINGVVTDPSGALVSAAKVEATNVATGVSHDTVTSSAGEFSFQDLPLGTYTVTTEASGFQKLKVDGVPVTAGVVYTLPIKMTVAQTATTVEVNAVALALDTTSTTQTSGVEGKALQDTPLNGRDFTQLVVLAPGFANSGAGGYGSLNGTRANQINWQIDGIDNNDLWHNIPAVNQGGVAGIAGIVMPIDAVQQFSVQTQAAVESGRNPGGSVNLSLKSGGNQLHGTAYYYNRNEALGAINPASIAADTPKQEVRNYNYGFSAGGPVVKDKLFWFVTYEHQRFVIGVPSDATEPSTGWQAAALAALDKYGVPVNAVSQNLLKTLWPSKVTGALSGDTATSGAVNNYLDSDPEFGYSYNGLAKVDWTIDSKNSLSAHWFAGQGNQVAPVGSDLLYYYEVAPLHVQNYALVFNHVFTPTMTNQVLAGVNYFNQVFNDYNNSFDMASLGLVTGSTLPGATNINIGSFDPVGETPPEGRNDITGHLTDDFSWVIGKHEIKFGGELRKAQLDEFYHRHALGSFTFNGTGGPLGSAFGDGSNTDDTWGTGDTGNAYTNSLADFLAGRYNTGSIALGDPDRQVFVNTFDFFAQDAFQVTHKLNVNYGLRWDYEGPLHNPWKNLSVFRPDLTTAATPGIAYQGAEISNLYDPKYTNFSPRAGISYQITPKTVFRAGVGLYYDTPNLNPFLDNRPGNGAPNGVEGNPGGPDPVITATTPTAGTIVDGVDVFSNPTASSSIFSIAKNFQPSHDLNYNAQIEQSLTDKVVAQIGYVASGARHLLSILDINQAAPSDSSTPIQTSRPYYSVYPNYTYINQIESIGTSNYNSLQATIKVANLHNFSGQATYTWSHNLDEVTAYRGALPQDSTNFKGDYGPSDFDQRNIFIAQATYLIPGGNKWKPLTNGWQLNTLATLHGGIPITVLSASDTSGTGEGTQRAELTGVSPTAGFKKQKIGANWLNPAAFTDPAPGTFGNSSRNAYAGPGFSDVDLSVFKNTPISERINTQFRVEMFNVFNRYNYGSPGGIDPNTAGATSLTLTQTIDAWNYAPGIGAGAPFNTQLSLKIIF
ncbi:TonB-dependent receptor domain-containing protein [Silvibacterium sp.]|uniref:TonB-dependent receptor n=1 Tax=Silvibacterium sp. TaxID=1964179 RepID=UPI0039E2FA52